MEKEVEDTRHLKGKERSYELYRRYMLPVFEAWMPVFEKYESGNRGRQCVMVTPMPAMTTKKWSKLVLDEQMGSERID